MRMPDRQSACSPLSAILEEAHARLSEVRRGDVATYIPALAAVPPDLFGLAVVTAGGALCVAGDAAHPFTIQSVSKPYTYALAIDLLGREALRAAVGVQPMADAFNALVFDPVRHRPFNPMVNAGSIAVAGLLVDALGAGAFDTIRERLSRAAGRDLALDAVVHRSEAETGHRNRAIAHLLHGAGVFRAPAEQAVEVYFQQCSVTVTAQDLATMGATLANVGTNPLTGAEVFGVDAVRDTLSVMFTCGLYDGAGDWACRVGVPAKSGVGGGLLAVVNRQLGIGVFSPRLDAAGNPVRGLLACEALAEELGLHLFEPSNPGSTLLRALAG
jgi:glutaminase